MSEKPLGRPPIPREDLLDELRRLADGETPPSVKEMKEQGQYSWPTYSNRFGSWNEAITAAGFEPRPAGGVTGKLDRDDLLDDLIAGYEVVGRWPTRELYRACGEYSTGPYYREFGSWDGAIAAAKERRAAQLEDGERE